jgi:hypothetical protein
MTLPYKFHDGDDDDVSGVWMQYSEYRTEKRNVTRVPHGPIS